MPIELSFDSSQAALHASLQGIIEESEADN